MTYADYINAGTQLRERFLSSVEDTVRGKFDLIASNDNCSILPTFRHIQSELCFRLILGGEFQMGLSEDEEHALYKLNPHPNRDIYSMKPVHMEKVHTILLSERPVLMREYLSLAGPLRHPKGLPDDFAAYVTKAEADRFCSLYGFRLPSEAEWEYSCRGGTTTLFPWGNTLLNDDDLNRWMSLEFDQYNSLASNSFGLRGLFAGTWCNDNYRESYATNEYHKDETVVRGGASYFWPWQDDEWVWCLSANRFPSSFLDEDRTCGLFLVFDLPNEQ